MKKIFFLVIIGVFSMSFQNIEAQQMRQIQPGQRGYRPPPKPRTERYIELKDAYEETKKMLPKCVEKFNLDDFKKEILKNILVENFEAKNVVIGDKDSSHESRTKRIIEIDKKFYQDLTLILTSEEIEAFKLMDFTETRKEKKKRKKKKS